MGDSNQLPKERLEFLDRPEATEADLTYVERVAGWHYCPQADGRLVGPGRRDIFLCRATGCIINTPDDPTLPYSRAWVAERNRKQ